MPKRAFNGRIALDARESVPDWSAYEPPRAPEGAPNILLVVWDDVGFGSFDCFGGMVETPTMSRIAARGLRFTQFHTTGLGAATRACLLTGRNAASNGMACMPEATTGFPASNGQVPFENAMLPAVLVENGYCAWALGKWHLAPELEAHAAGSRRHWPLGRGFERFYGFLGRETSQWHPLLVQDHQSIEQPYRPEHGYHLTADLADTAIRYIQDARAVAPDKPWLMYFAPGCAHAPLHVAPEWSERYRGRFELGYEAYRERVLARQLELGLVPAGTTLPPLDPYRDARGPRGETWPAAATIRAWSSLAPDEQQRFCRMAEVYAGYIDHCDHHIGRILDFLALTEQLDNTLVIVCSDDGASGDAGPDGTAAIEGGLCTGWAQAFCAPFKLFKCHAGHEGGTAAPLLVSWPRRITARGELRHQYCHATDIAPTIYDCVGITQPDVVHGYPQSALEGESVAHTFDNEDAPTRKQMQLYSALGTRAIWADGWKAATVHPPMAGWGLFEHDRWELHDIASDRTQTRDLAAAHPQLLEKLKSLWAMLAGAYHALPLDDRTAAELAAVPRPAHARPRYEYIYYPSSEPVPHSVSVDLAQHSFEIDAEVDIHDGHPEGVVFAQGSHGGGHTIYVHDGRVHYVYNWLGKVQQKLTSSKRLSSGKHTLAVVFEAHDRDTTNSAVGPARLLIDDEEVAAAEIRTQPDGVGADDVVTIGRDVGSPASDDYRSPAHFQGGVIERVKVAIKGD